MKPNSLEPSSLLIIDDAPVHSAVIDRTARRAGFVATVAHSYEDACEQLSRRQFDCITLDLGLNDHGGADVLRHLAAIRCAAKIIVISQSDKDTCDDMVQLGRALDLKVYKYVQKPIDLEALRRALENMRAQAMPRGDVVAAALGGV
jgi:CheY-like chemotaxis protein